MQNIIEQKLQRVLKPALLEIVNTSARHAGHAGSPDTGQSHFDVTVVSKEFIGQSLLQRHRLVYDILAAEMRGKIHALAVKSYTPQEWRNKQNPLKK